MNVASQRKGDFAGAIMLRIEKIPLGYPEGHQLQSHMFFAESSEGGLKQAQEKLM